MSSEEFKARLADFVDDLRASEATVVHTRVDYERERPRLDFDLVDPDDESIVVELAREYGFQVGLLTGVWVQISPQEPTDSGLEERTTRFLEALEDSDARVENLSSEDFYRHKASFGGTRVTLDIVDPDDVELIRDIAETYDFVQVDDHGEIWERGLE